VSSFTLRRHGALRAAAAFTLYAALALLFFARALAGAFTTSYLGRDTDPSEFMWFIKWWPYAIGHHLNPFFSDLVWAPHGTSLAWATSIPLPAFAAFPIEHALGSVAAYNALCLAAVVLAAFAAFLLCRWITGAFWPSVMGGFIFGFSPYMLGQLLCHLDLVLVFPVPLALLVALKRYRGEMGNRGFIAALALVLVAQFLCFPEIFATMTVFGAIALALALAILPGRSRLAALIVPIAAAYLVAVALLSPYLYQLFSNNPPGGPLYWPDQYSADLLNFVVPTEANLLGLLPWLSGLSRKFGTIIYENGACLGIPLIVVTEAWRRSHRREPATKLIMLVLLAVCLAALGPVLHIAGRAWLPTPWALAAHLPLISIALPGRFMVYAFLILAVIAALWLASSTATKGMKALAAAAIAISMLPNPSARFWATPLDVPRFFHDGAWRKYIANNEIILPLPYERLGMSMLWQAEAGMAFRMASGYTTRTPFEFDRLPIVSFFFGAIDLAEADEHLKAFVAEHGISAIVVDLDDPHLNSWLPVLGALQIAPVSDGGVWVYEIPKDAFPAYAKLSGENLERRAVALRFDRLLAATATFLAQANPARDLSALALKSDRLLPTDWVVDTERNAFHDFWVGQLPDGRIGIAVGGSYGALRPLGERYRSIATSIRFPSPRQWNPAARYRTDVARRSMLFEFEPAALARAAAQLKSSPPSELTSSIFPRVPPN
jgi:hypothetical protein